MNFGATLTRLDAARLQQTAKATIQGNGRLSFSVEAGRLMNLTDDASLIIFSAENGDLGATVSTKGDPQAFELKKAGAYYYISFKNYLQEMGINYKSQRILYDITQLNEQLEGRTLFRFARRVLPREASNLPLTNGTVPEVSESDFEEPADNPPDDFGEDGGVPPPAQEQVSPVPVPVPMPPIVEEPAKKVPVPSSAPPSIGTSVPPVLCGDNSAAGNPTVPSGSIHATEKSSSTENSNVR